MRKTVIALLLVFAMLMVSCKPENTVKEPTADEFLSSLYAAIVCEGLIYDPIVHEKAIDSDGNIIKDKVAAVALTNYLEDSEGLNRYHVTEITEVSGKVKSRYEAEDVVIRFKYYAESRENKQTEFKCNHTAENEKTGVLAFSFKATETESETTYTNIKLNFNPYKDVSMPSVTSAETTSFKSISYTFDKTEGKLADSASVEGVKLNDTEWAKVDPVINAGH